MPKVTLPFTDEATIPAELKAFKTADNKVIIWVNTDETAMAAELNPGLEKNRNDLKVEKEVFEARYKSAIENGNKDVTTLTNKIADMELKSKSAISIPEDDKRLLDVIKAVKADATPEYVKETLEKYPTLLENVQKNEAEKTNEILFKASGYKNRQVFDTVYNNAGLNPNFDSVVMKDEKDTSGNPVKVPYIKVKNAVEGKSELSVAEYAKSSPEWNHFTPALTFGQDNTAPFNAFEQNPSFETNQFQTATTGQQPKGQANPFLSAMETHDSNVIKAQQEAAKK